MSQQHEALAAIDRAVAVCTKCRLHERRTKAVPGEGSFDAEIMFIGEGPGRDEDLQGRPFIGAAGRLLTEMLAEVGIPRPGVYITNVVKCRPPENRDPLLDEIETCTSLYLLSQIELINPKLIVFLGRHSFNLFFPERKISRDHGKVLARGGRHFMPLYHPAVALYKADMKETLLEDFRRLPKALAVIKKGETTKSDRSAEQPPLF